MNKYEQALRDIKMEYREMKEERKSQLNEDEKVKFDLLQELVDRATPKKSVIKVTYNLRNSNREHHCPHCGKWLTSHEKYCSNCGQALDWGA